MNSMSGCYGQNEPQTSTPLKLVHHFLSTGNRFDMQSNQDDESNMHGKNTRFLGTRAVSILNKWFNDNRDYPYPNDLITEKLARDANISAKQVKKWFANKRVRSQSCFKPIHRTRKRSSSDQTSSPTWTNQPEGNTNYSSEQQPQSSPNRMNLFPPSQYFANMSNDLISRSLLPSLSNSGSHFFSALNQTPQTNISFLKSLAASFYTQQQQMALLSSLLSQQNSNNKSCSSSSGGSNYSRSTNNETGIEMTSNSQNNEEDLSISIENLSSSAQHQDQQPPHTNETASSNLSSIDTSSSANISPTISSSSPASTSTSSSSKSMTDPSMTATPRLSLADPTAKTTKLEKKINFAVISTLID